MLAIARVTKAYRNDFLRLRRLTFAFAAGAFMLSFFHRVAPSAVAAELSTSFATSATGLGSLAAAYFYIYLVMQVPAGILADTWGPRRMFVAGCLVSGCGSALFGLAPSFGFAFCGRFLVGLGVSVIFVAALKLIAAWYDVRQFGTMSGWLMFLAQCGGLLATAPLAAAASIVGWRTVFVAAGVLAICVALGCWWLVADRPADRGFVHHDGGGAAAQPWRAGLASVLRNRHTWPACVMAMGVTGSMMSFVGLWSVPFFEQTLGLGRAAATSHVSVLLACAAIGAVLAGRASDHLHVRLTPMRVLITAYCLTWVPWVLGVVPPPPWSFGSVALMGLCMGATPLGWAYAKEVNPPAFAGIATSVVNVGPFVGAAILQPGVGAILDFGSARGWSSAVTWQVACAALFGFALLGLLCTLLMRETGCRNVYASDPA